MPKFMSRRRCQRSKHALKTIGGSLHMPTHTQMYCLCARGHPHDHLSAVLCMCPHTHRCIVCAQGVIHTTTCAGIKQRKRRYLWISQHGVILVKHIDQLCRQPRLLRIIYHLCRLVNQSVCSELCFPQMSNCAWKLVWRFPHFLQISLFVLSTRERTRSSASIFAFQR